MTNEGRFPIDLATHLPDTRIRALDQDGVDVAVLSLQTTLGLELLDAGERDELEELWAEGVREIVASGGGRFLALAPSRARTGFPGISIGASSLLDLDRAGPILDEAAARNCVVFVHPEVEEPPVGARPDWWSWALGYTAQMQAAYLAWLGSGRERWPTLRIVFAILAGGAPFQLERLTHRGCRRALGARSEHVLRRRDVRPKGYRARRRDVRCPPACLRKRHACRRFESDT